MYYTLWYLASTQFINEGSVWPGVVANISSLLDTPEGRGPQQKICHIQIDLVGSWGGLFFSY